jgi:hypothetical protein
MPGSWSDPVPVRRPVELRWRSNYPTGRERGLQPWIDRRTPSMRLCNRGGAGSPGRTSAAASAEECTMLNLGSPGMLLSNRPAAAALLAS